MLGSLGMQEMLVIAAVALLIFGPRQLPKLGKSLGETVKAIRDIPAAMHDDKDDEA